MPKIEASLVLFSLYRDVLWQEKIVIKMKMDEKTCISIIDKLRPDEERVGEIERCRRDTMVLRDAGGTLECEEQASACSHLEESSKKFSLA